MDVLEGTHHTFRGGKPSSSEMWKNGFEMTADNIQSKWSFQCGFIQETLTDCPVSFREG